MPLRKMRMNRARKQKARLAPAQELAGAQIGVRASLTAYLRLSGTRMVSVPLGPGDMSGG